MSLALTTVNGFSMYDFGLIIINFCENDSRPMISVNNSFVLLIPDFGFEWNEST